MEMNELIAKINYYSRLSRERELTEEEKKIDKNTDKSILKFLKTSKKSFR